MAGLYAEVRARAADEPEAALAAFRAGRDELFRTHPESPLSTERRASFGGLAYAPYDPELRFEVEVDTGVEALRLEIETSAGEPMVLSRFGTVHLPVGDLDVFWIAVYGGGVFLPFRDTTAGELTYGGGRYLLDTVKGADLGGDDGRLVVDLNYAYHPSCFYDPRWSCPLAPPGNRLGCRVVAGELSRPL